MYIHLFYVISISVNRLYLPVAFLFFFFFSTFPTFFYPNSRCLLLGGSAVLGQRVAGYMLISRMEKARTNNCLNR
jgi:hypothetical protein